MPSWTDVKGLVEERYPLLRDEGRAIEVSVRETRVELELFEGRARGAVALVARVCALRFIDASWALGYNASSAHGALVVRRGHYLLRQVLPLDGLTEGTLGEALAGLAGESTRLAKAHVRPSLPAAIYRMTFAAFAD